MVTRSNNGQDSGPFIKKILASATFPNKLDLSKYPLLLNLHIESKSIDI